VFGEWDKPTPQVPSTVVEEAKVLGAAEAKGAIVTVTYKVGNTTFTAKFEKGDGDNYTLISNTKNVSAARALTRLAAATTPGKVPEGDASAVGSKIQLKLEGGKLKLIVKDETDAPLFEAQFKIETGETTVFNTNALGLNFIIGDFAVNDDKKDIKNPEMQEVKIDCLGQVNYTVLYDSNKGEKWSDVVDRYKDCEQAEITATEDYISIKFSKEAIVAAIMSVTIVDKATAEATYTSSFEGKTFYLTSYNPSALTARGMTRAFVGTYVKANDAIDPNLSYSLTVYAPGTTSN